MRILQRKPRECLDGDDADTAADAEEVGWAEKEVRRREGGRKEEEDGDEAGSPCSASTSHS